MTKRVSVDGGDLRIKLTVAYILQKISAQLWILLLMISLREYYVSCLFSPELKVGRMSPH